jgi:ribonuclease D
VSEFDIITRASELKTLAQDLLKEDIVAFDTEADSFYHYFDKTCLVQIATREQTWLVDPLALGGPSELAPLAPVFASPKVRVLFHAAEYDLFILKRDCGFSFANLFDTMVSAQLLGYEAVGLAALIDRHFGVHLPKDEQRSDWSRRPLSSKQLEYAASDVLYLIRLAETLEEELIEKDRLSWAKVEFESLIAREWPERTFDPLGYLRIKGARLLEPVSLAVLREIFLTRDLRAREIDRPPFKVLGNRTMLEIAKAQPASSGKLAQIKGVTDLIVRRVGGDLLLAIEKGIAKPHGPIPRSPTSTTRRRMDKPAERRLATLKTWRVPRSKELGLDPGVLCPNSALEAIAIAHPESAAEFAKIEEIKPWLAKSFGAEIVEFLATKTSSKDSDGKSGGHSKGSRRRRS